MSTEEEMNSSAEPPAEKRDDPYELKLRNGSMLNALSALQDAVKHSEIFHHGLHLGSVTCFQPCIVARYSDSAESVDASR